jgi:hypothetical protein
VLADQDTATLRFVTLAVGVLPVGIETAFAVGEPSPLCVQAAIAAAG